MFSANSPRIAKLLALVVIIGSSILSMAVSMGVSAAEYSASDWLAKMDKALREQNYSGTFIFFRGAHFETIEIVHQFKDGEEFERLTSLSGEEREIIRGNGTTVCYHIDGEHVKLSHAMPMGPFSYSFREKLDVNKSAYNISQHGIERIAGHDAMRIAIRPKNADRHGYRLWIDESTGLLLKSNMVNGGRSLESFQFTSVEIGGKIKASQLASSFTKNSVQHSLTQSQQEIARQQQVARDWRVAWIPKGFRRVKASAQNSMTYTDGIANLTVFVERDAKLSLGNTQAFIGGTVVITRRLKDSSQQITVVGEVPLATAKRVAESIEPVIY